MTWEKYFHPSYLAFTLKEQQINLEAAILELNERRLVISLNKRAWISAWNALAAHELPTWVKKQFGGVCGGMSGGVGCLRFDPV